MAGEKKHTLYCSFCGKSQYEVKKLIAGPAVFICDECTILTFDILVEDNFHSRENISREQQVLMREKRVNELITHLEAIIETEEARSRPYSLLKKKVHEFKFLHGPPEKRATTQQ